MIFKTHLYNLSTAPFPDDHLVSLAPRRTWLQLRALVAQTTVSLKGQAGTRWLCCAQSSFRFAASLLACWQRAHVPVIAPDTQPGTLNELAGQVRGALCDQPLNALDAPQLRLDELEQVETSGLAPGDSEVCLQPVETTAARTTAPALELFTSGSTGVRKRLLKRFDQLQAECEVLEQQWGEQCGTKPRLSTVSHSHIYGLLFRVLWPLLRGAPMVDRNQSYWEELFAFCGVEGQVLVSSPAHLRFLGEAASESKLNWSKTVIFSSGGPLAPVSAQAVFAACGQVPIEVFGSTETGGIAWRTQPIAGHHPWMPLPRVCIRLEDEESRLSVRSPFLEEPRAWRLTDDKVRLHQDGRFDLLGRVDRIVKISEKRVSLTRMEHTLVDSGLVRQCRIFPKLQNNGRQALACVARPTDQGSELINKAGRQAMIEALRLRLGSDFERVCWPRFYRFPQNWPMNNLGKTTQTDLDQLFEQPAVRPNSPQRLAATDEDGGQRIRFWIPGNLPCLDGHFPGQAVVPGIAQVQWATESLGDFLGTPVAVTRIERLKFNRPLLPDHEVDLILKPGKSDNCWLFRYLAGELIHSSGRLVVQP